MYICAFIDWENIEKTAKQEYGSIILYEKFVNVIKNIAASENLRLVGIQAYGDFDKGTAGLMSKLVNLGIEPHHIVTKTSREYLKGSVDIELSLDILETMYNYKHITDFLLCTGDSDVRYVSNRLIKNGRRIKLLGFKEHTSQFLINLVDEFIPLDDYSQIFKKITSSEKEVMAESLISNKYVHLVIKHVDRLESEKKFIGLNFLKNRLVDHNQFSATQICDALTDCIDCGILDVYYVDNPNDPCNPTRACKLNRSSKVVNYILR